MQYEVGQSVMIDYHRKLAGSYLEMGTTTDNVVLDGSSSKADVYVTIWDSSGTVAVTRGSLSVTKQQLYSKRTTEGASDQILTARLTFTDGFAPASTMTYRYQVVYIKSGVQDSVTGEFTVYVKSPYDSTFT